MIKQIHRIERSRFARRSIRSIRAIRVGFFISYGFHRFLSFFLILYRSLEQHPPNFASEIKKTNT